MINVEIHNFQSLDRVAVDIDRYTAIVGRSNIGKSAIVRAVGCALTGAEGVDFVRHVANCDRRTRGTTKCKCFSKVVLKSSKMTLTWEKGDYVNRYTYEVPGGPKQTYEGHGGGTPDFLQEDFPKVKIGDGKELIQIPTQFESIFLLNKSGPVVADVLSDVARLDRINVAMTSATKDRKEAASKKKVRDEDVVSLTKSLLFYHGLDVSLIKAKGIRDKHSQIQFLEGQRKRVEIFIASISALSASVEALAKMTQVDIPDVPQLGSKGMKLLEVEAYLAQVADKAPIIRQLSGIEIVKIPEVPAIEKIAARLEQTSQWAMRTASLEEATCKLSAFEIPDIANPNLNFKLSRIQDVGQWDLRLAKLVSEITASEAEVVEIEQSLSTILNEFDAIGICPTCSNPISKTHQHLEAVG